MKPLAGPLRSLVALGTSLRRRGARQAVDGRAAGDIACRNCGADAPGNFCPACGQETALELPHAARFMREAAGRYVAFDGRMWRTLFALLARPGFLTREYLAGRRKRYVRPARLVLVLAIVLFAVVRLFADPDDMVRYGVDESKTAGTAAPKAASAAPAGMAAGAGTASRASPFEPVIEFDHEPLTIGSSAGGVRIDESLNVHLSGPTTPFGDRLEKRFDSFNRLERGQKVREIVAGMLRYGPYALIALLPFYAWLVQVLYLGRARRYPARPRRYAEHLVYAAHTHAFIALVVTLMIAIPWPSVAGVLALWSVLYLLASLHAVYGGRWSGVLVRGFVATIVYAVFFGLAVVGLFVAAILLR